MKHHSIHRSKILWSRCYWWIKLSRRHITGQGVKTTLLLKLQMADVIKLPVGLCLWPVQKGPRDPLWTILVRNKKLLLLLHPSNRSIGMPNNAMSMYHVSITVVYTVITGCDVNKLKWLGWWLPNQNLPWGPINIKASPGKIEDGEPHLMRKQDVLIYITTDVIFVTVSRLEDHTDSNQNKILQNTKYFHLKWQQSAHLHANLNL